MYDWSHILTSSWQFKKFFIITQFMIMTYIHVQLYIQSPMTRPRDDACGLFRYIHGQLQEQKKLPLRASAVYCLVDEVRQGFFYSVGG